MTPHEQAEAAYHQAHAAMSDTLAQGSVDERGLQAMREGVASIGRVKDAFGADRYWVLRRLLAACEELPRYDSSTNPVGEPVYEPMFGHEHHRQMQPYRQVPYPYRLGKWDPAWVLVLFLAALSFVSPIFGLLAGFIAFMRALVWCGFRFPMTTIFFTSFFSGLLGGGRRGRW